MKTRILPIFLLVAALFACDRDDPDPDPEPKRAYCSLFNFLMTDPVTWEVAGTELPNPIVYGGRFLGAVILDEETQQVPFTFKITGSGDILKSQLVSLSENVYYQIVLCGTVEDPILLINEEMVSSPGGGMIQFQFLHVASDQDSMDVYMGGTDPEHKVVSSIDYAEFTDYFEVTDYEARVSATVASAGDTFDPDSLLIEYTYNEPLQSEGSYLIVVAHDENLFTSELALFLFMHNI